MARSLLPPGFRFHPTDPELISFYLKKKILGKKLPFEAISELNIYKFLPWHLPDKACLRSKDLEWYFFCPTEKKYASGARMNRSTENGYWKATGKDRVVTNNGQTVGMVKTLVFHQGHAPNGERTDWVIHEYRIQDSKLADAGVAQDGYVICKVFQKSGPGPKNGAQYGAPFIEEDWDDDIEFSFGSVPVLAPTLTINDSKNPCTNISTPNENGSIITNIVTLETAHVDVSSEQLCPSNASPQDGFTEDEIAAFLDMDICKKGYVEVPAVNNNNIEKHSIHEQGNSSNLDENDAFNLDDLCELGDRRGSGFDSRLQSLDYAWNHMSPVDDNDGLKLSDLDNPLKHPTQGNVCDGASFDDIQSTPLDFYGLNQNPRESADVHLSSLTRSVARPEGRHQEVENQVRQRKRQRFE